MGSGTSLREGANKYTRHLKRYRLANSPGFHAKEAKTARKNHFCLDPIIRVQTNHHLPFLNFFASWRSLREICYPLGTRAASAPRLISNPAPPHKNDFPFAVFASLREIRHPLGHGLLLSRASYQIPPPHTKMISPLRSLRLCVKSAIPWDTGCSCPAPHIKSCKPTIQTKRFSFTVSASRTHECARLRCTPPDGSATVSA
jgi:hypothetical protein